MPIPALLIPVAFGAAVVSGLVWAWRKGITSVLPGGSATNIKPPTSTISKKGIVERSPPKLSDLVEVKLGDETWLVARDYIGPIGIGEAAALATSLGMQLPTAALVDAIWRQADLKLLPMPRNDIVSQAVFDDQARKIDEAIGGRDFTLMEGAFKDIVMQSDKFPGLYGWHVEDSQAAAFTKKTGIPLHAPVTRGPGRIIQGQSGHVHGLFFKDYSQGLRLVKKVG